MLNFLRSCWRTSGKFKFGVLVLACFVGIALMAPLFYRPIIGENTPARPGLFRRWEAGSAAHPLGTDGHGRDLLTDYLAGLRTTLFIGFLAGIVGTGVGVFVGFISGYKGGTIDSVLLTITNMLIVIPSYPILVALAMVTPELGVATMALILALFSWPFSARTIRAQVMTMKERPYIELAKVSGQSDFAIIFTEILPNLMPYLLMGFAFSTVGAMVAEVGIEAIGLGPSNIITLGLMINFANGWAVYSMGRLEILLIPVSALVLIFMAITMINRGMEEYLNPRLQKVTTEK
ncbi:MAG: ABC transporter permease [Anaerolineae bacterium]|nr:ABC transporter permease [Anaerolineae bacterium]